MASRVDVVLLVFRPGTPYYPEALEDPAGFVARRRDALNGLAGERMVAQRLFPFSRGNWAVVLPDADPTEVLPSIEGLYGRVVAATVGRAIAQFPDAVVCWVAVWVSEKGYDSAEVRDAS